MQRSQTMRAMSRWFLGALGVVGSVLACETEPRTPLAPKSDAPASHVPATGVVGGPRPTAVPPGDTTHVGSTATHGSDGQLDTSDELDGREEEAEEEAPSDDAAGEGGGAPSLGREGHERGRGGAASTGGSGNGGARYENVGGARNAAGSGGSAGAAGANDKEPMASEEHRYALMQVVTSGSLP
jgi:hypothetical protein